LLSATPRRYRPIVMIGDDIDALCRGSKQVGGVGPAAARAGAENLHAGCFLLHEGAENRKVPCVSGGVIAFRRAADGGKVRLVHEFDCCDAPTDRSRRGEQTSRLLRLPDAGGVAYAGADRE